MTKTKKRKNVGSNSPGTQQSQSSTGQFSPPKSKSCGQCRLLVASSEYVPLKCFVCQHIFHDECLNFEPDHADTLRTIVEYVGWVCESCRNTARNQVSSGVDSVSMVKLQTEVVDLKGFCSNVQKELHSLKVALDTMPQKCMDTIQYGPPASQPSTSATSQVPNLVSNNSVPNQWTQIPPWSRNNHFHPHPPPPQAGIMDTDTVLRSVCHELKDKEKRKRNVIVSGLKPDSKVDDITLFNNLCVDYLNLNCSGEIDHKLSRRLLSYKPIQPYLIVFKREEPATEILRYARALREADDPHVSSSVFINADLTPTEAKIAFEMREKRRSRLSQRSNTQRFQQSNQNVDMTGPSRMDVVNEVNDDIPSVIILPVSSIDPPGTSSQNPAQLGSE